MRKENIINQIISIEGGYVDNPNDSGGPTNFGITTETARENGYHGPMEHLPRDLAFDIYAAKYWDAVNADQLLAISQKVAAEVVDTGVNMGPPRAAMILQRALRVMVNRDLHVDGDIGPATLAALKRYMAERDEAVLLKALNCLQGVAYIDLAERRKKDRAFVYGWIRARVEL